MVSEDILWKQKKKNSLLNVNIVSEDIYSKKRRLQKNGSWMVSEDILWKKKSCFTEWKKNLIWWVRTFFNVEKELLYWMYHIWWVRTYDAKKKPLNVDEKKLIQNGEWGRDMIKKIRLEKIRLVIVSEDI